MMKKWVWLLLAALLLCCGLTATAAQAAETRTVRIAYPIQEGLTDLDEYGNFTGYTYEYLEEIAQYTGWNYEFVQVPGNLNQRLTTLMEMVQNGEVDLMGAMLYDDSLNTVYDYSNSYGVTETVLQIPNDSPQIPVINSQFSQTLRIAVTGMGARTTQELEDYCSMNLITPEYIYCKNSGQQLQAVREGRADCLLNTSANYLEGVHTIARFAPKPFYFVTTKNANRGLIEQLNAALLNIEQVDPTFSTTLYDKYFTPPHNVLSLSANDRQYIAAAPVIQVGVLTNLPPFQYLDAAGQPKGISVDLLHYISEKTGLKFEFVEAATQAQLYELAKTGKITVVAGMPYDYLLAQEQNLSMTRFYISSQYIMMRNQNNSEENIAGKRLAMVRNNTYRKHYYIGKVQYYDTIEACIQAVETGKADYTYVNSYTAQYYINLPAYHNLKLVPQTYEPGKTSFGMVKPSNQRLLSIFNKVINTIPTADMQALIYQNTIQKQPFSLGCLIRQNPLEFIAAIAVVFLLIISCLLYILWQRAKMNKQTSLELKKHLRVYGLAHEHFLEYHFKNRTMLLSSPSEQGEGQPVLVQYDYNKLSEDPHQREQQVAFLAIIRSQQDGITEIQLDCPDHKTHWLRIALETIYDGNAPAYALGKINIIDGEKREKDALLAKAQLDGLTQIYNAETSHSLIAEQLAQLAGGDTGALLLLDIDNFKAVNDTYGHLCGDQVLNSVAQLLKNNFRSEDIVGRPGGDEFIVYLPSLKDQQALAEKCAALCAKVRQLQVAGCGRLTISVGAVLATAAAPYEQLYQLADKALYAAKRQGRDGFSIADATDSQLAGEL